MPRGHERGLGCSNAERRNYSEDVYYFDDGAEDIGFLLLIIRLYAVVLVDSAWRLILSEPFPFSWTTRISHPTARKFHGGAR